MGPVLRKTMAWKTRPLQAQWLGARWPPRSCCVQRMQKEMPAPLNGLCGGGVGCGAVWCDVVVGGWVSGWVGGWVWEVGWGAVVWGGECREHKIEVRSESGICRMGK
jgi:hypothetical protein